MSRQKSKTIIVSLAVAIIFILIAVLFPFDTVFQKKNKPYTVENSRLINRAQGYSFTIPDGFSLNDAFYPYCLRLESENTVIEFYRENLDSAEQFSYISYTNKAITQNSVDYLNVSQQSADNLSVLQWERMILSRIPNDKNRYMKIDISSDDAVYTILIKSSLPLSAYQTYTSLFRTEEITESAEITYKKKKPSGRKFNTETKKLYKNVFQKKSRLSWGIFHPEFMTNDSLAQYEKEIDHKFDFVLWYVGFTKDYIPEKIGGFLEKAYADGKIAEMTLQPRLSHEQGNDIFRLLNGEYDAFFDECAKAIADFDHPVLFRLANEMNGDWCEYSAYQMSLDTELYREMYKYVYSFFEKHEADNVIWIFNPNGKSFPDYQWNAEDMYYPSDAYVDVYGLTLYNTGNFYEGEEWTEFSDLYRPLYEASTKKYDMPFMITEFACARAGGNKEAWTKKMLSEIESFENIKLAVWWNHADFDENGDIARAYYINDSEEMNRIFKDYFAKKK